MREDGDDAGRPRFPAAAAALRAAGLTGGFLLAVAATATVLLTEDPQLLRVAVVAAAWAFVLAALAAVRRRGPGAGAVVEPATAERRVAARTDPAPLAADDPHHQAAGSMCAELAELRRDLAGVSGLRDIPAEVVALRRELGDLRAGLAQVALLRDHVAQLAGLRGDLAELAGLRGDPVELAGARAAIGRLRAEPADQLSGEMLVERVLLRTQSTRTGPATTESPGLHPVDQDWSSSSGAGSAAAPPTVQGEELPGARTSIAPEPRRPVTAPPVPPAPPAPAVAPPPPPPLAWLAERELVDPDVLARTRHAAAAPPVRPAVPPSDELRRRRTDDHLPDEGPSPEARPPVLRRERPPVPAAGRARRPGPPAAPRSEEVFPPHRQGGSSPRLAELLAENGIQLSSGGRRRHRYREDDEPDDVLARVLGRS